MTANQGENIQYKYNTQGLVTEVHHNNIKRVVFFYDERGQRIKKISYDATGTAAINTDYYIRDLSGNVMSIYNSSIGNNNTITQTELPIYGGSRLGVYTRNGTTQYQITDHLGNVRAVIEKNTQNPLGVDQTDYSDYYPFGEKLPMRNMFSKYRYAFQGQELDPETGKEAFQLRLWDGRIGRWLTTDPYGQYHSPYLGMGNDPVNGIDPDGGYKNRVSQWFGWALGGFQGKRVRGAGEGDMKYAIQKTTKGKDIGLDMPEIVTTLHYGNGYRLTEVNVSIGIGLELGPVSGSYALEIAIGEDSKYFLNGAARAKITTSADSKNVFDFSKWKKFGGGALKVGVGAKMSNERTITSSFKSSTQGYVKREAAIFGNGGEYKVSLDPNSGTTTYGASVKIGVDAKMPFAKTIGVENTHTGSEKFNSVSYY